MERKERTKQPTANISKYLKQIWDGISTYRILSLAGSISFFGAMSIAPLFVIVTYFSGFLFGESASKGELFRHLRYYVGSNAAELIEKAVVYASTHPGKYPLIFSIIIAAWGATGFFQEIRGSLHLIWEVKDKEGILAFLGRQGHAITGVFIYGVICVAVFALYAFLSSFSLFWGKLTALIEVIFSFVVLTISFAIAYKFFSGAKAKWISALKGASFSSVLFIFGRVLFSIYLKRAVSISLYAAMGSLMALLLWLYISSVIFLVGAEIARFSEKK
jgi:membrane protein